MFTIPGLTIKELTRFPLPHDCRVEVAQVEGHVAIGVFSEGSQAAVVCPVPQAIDIATRILELAGCSVRRVAFGHMLPDQVTVGVPPEIVDGEVEELPEAET